MNPKHNHFEVVIPSDYESGQAVVEQIMLDVAECGFSSRDLFGVRLAVDEAVTNAIKHGNRLSPNKTVRVLFSRNQSRIRIEVEDQGAGFHPEDVPDPTADENLDRPSGRGLLLMREFMTLIEYSPKGNQVVLEKHFSS